MEQQGVPMSIAILFALVILGVISLVAVVVSTILSTSLA